MLDFSEHLECSEIYRIESYFISRKALRPRWLSSLRTKPQKIDVFQYVQALKHERMW